MTRGRTILVNETCYRPWRFAFSVQLKINLFGIYKKMKFSDLNKKFFGANPLLYLVLTILFLLVF